MIIAGNPNGAFMMLISAGNCARFFNTSGVDFKKVVTITQQFVKIRQRLAHETAAKESDEVLTKEFQKNFEQIEEYIKAIQNEAKLLKIIIDIKAFYTSVESSPASQDIPIALDRKTLESKDKEKKDKPAEIGSKKREREEKEEKPRIRAKETERERPREKERTSDYERRREREKVYEQEERREKKPKSEEKQPERESERRHEGEKRREKEEKPREREKETERERHREKERAGDYERGREREKTYDKEERHEKKPRKEEKLPERDSERKHEGEKRREKEEESERKKLKKVEGETGPEDELKHKRRDEPDKDDPSSGFGKQTQPSSSFVPLSLIKDEKKTSTQSQGQTGGTHTKTSALNIAEIYGRDLEKHKRKQWETVGSDKSQPSESEEKSPRKEVQVKKIKTAEFKDLEKIQPQATNRTQPNVNKPKF